MCSSGVCNIRYDLCASLIPVTRRKTRPNRRIDWLHGGRKIIFKRLFNSNTWILLNYIPGHRLVLCNHTRFICAYILLVQPLHLIFKLYYFFIYESICLLMVRYQYSKKEKRKLECSFLNTGSSLQFKDERNIFFYTLLFISSMNNLKLFYR